MDDAYAMGKKRFAALSATFTAGSAWSTPISSYSRTCIVDSQRPALPRPSGRPEAFAELTAKQFVDRLRTVPFRARQAKITTPKRFAPLRSLLAARLVDILGAAIPRPDVHPRASAWLASQSITSDVSETCPFCREGSNPPAHRIQRYLSGESSCSFGNPTPRHGGGSRLFASYSTCIVDIPGKRSLGPTDKSAWLASESRTWDVSAQSSFGCERSNPPAPSVQALLKQRVF